MTEVRIGNVRRSQLAQAQCRQPLAHVDAGLELLALHNAGHEASCESITGTCRINNLVLVDGVDRVALCIAFILDGNHSRVGALCDDRNTLPLCVLLWEVGECFGNGWDVVGVQVVRIGIGNGFCLVANDIIPVRSSLVKRILEELGDERRRERKDERLRPLLATNARTCAVPVVKLTLFVFAASSASFKTAGTQTVK